MRADDYTPAEKAIVDYIEQRILSPVLVPRFPNLTLIRNSKPVKEYLEGVLDSMRELEFEEAMSGLIESRMLIPVEDEFNECEGGFRYRHARALLAIEAERLVHADGSWGVL